MHRFRNRPHRRLDRPQRGDGHAAFFDTAQQVIRQLGKRTYDKTSSRISNPVEDGTLLRHDIAILSNVGSTGRTCFRHHTRSGFTQNEGCPSHEGKNPGGGYVAFHEAIPTRRQAFPQDLIFTADDDHLDAWMTR